MRLGRIDVNGAAVWAELDADGHAHVLRRAPWDGIERTGERVAAAQVRLLAPAEPSKVVCIGLNYLDHIEEMKHAGPPADPVIFIKPSTSVIGPGQPIVRPAFSQRVDHEAELAVVISKRMKDVAEADALSYVLGYTCLNDVTARDIQRADGQWTRGKGIDGFCPIGPWIETDLSPDDLAITGKVNGEVRQQSTTKLLIHPVAKLLSFISAAMTLLPGDVVSTGTPAGVGPMVAGDTVEIEIAGIGILSNPVR